VLVVSSAAALSGCLTPVEPIGLGDLLPEQTDPGQLQISGEPQRVAIVNERYEFLPWISGGGPGTLTFTIQNMPRWAEIDPNTGLLSGSPTFADSDSYDDIVIMVTDGNRDSSLPAFSIAVSQDGLGAATLTWLAPERNIDGSYITNLAGYRIYYGMESGRYDQTIEISNIGITAYVIDNLRPGTYFFAATAYNQSNLESDYSNEEVKSIVIN
jgi:hypothetical protein